MFLPIAGFGVDRIIVGRVVRDYLKSQAKENPFKDGVPGKKWWRGFLNRWPSLSERKPQHFPTSRAEASTPEVMDIYFHNLQVHYTYTMPTTNANTYIRSKLRYVVCTRHTMHEPKQNKMQTLTNSHI